MSAALNDVVAAPVPVIGRRRITWREYLTGQAKTFITGGVALTNAKDQSATYFRIPWVAVGIIVVFAGLWWNAHNAANDARVAQATQMTALSGKIDALTGLVNDRNQQLTQLDSDIKEANRRAEAAQDQALTAQDFVTQVRIELAQRGIKIKEKN